MGTINDLIKHLNGFANELESIKQVTLKLEPDENNMIQKECPNDVCSSKFLVDIDDWKAIFKDEQVFCPVCQTSDLAKNFMPSAYIAALKDQLGHSIKQRWENGSPIKIDGLQIDRQHEPICAFNYECISCKAKYSTQVKTNTCPSCGKHQR